MAKPLVFQFGDTDLSFTLDKVDRSKLYGYKELEVLDESGQRCELATLAADGRTIVGRGGTGIGHVSADGQWCEKTALTPVDLNGNEITPVPSSFNAPIKLFHTATVDEYLDHNIRLVYQLATAEDASELLLELEQGTIFSFPYSYRGGLEADAGFLLMGHDGTLFLVVGNPTTVDYVGFQQPAAVVDQDELEDDEDEMDLMDFGMI